MLASALAASGPSQSPSEALGYLVAAAAAFIGCLAVQFVGYDRILAAGLRAPEVAERQRALKRWLVFALTWQTVVIAGVLVYAVAMSGTRRAGLAWVAPPLGALLGTALPYQLAAMRLIRGLTQ